MVEAGYHQSVLVGANRRDPSGRGRAGCGRLVPCCRSRLTDPQCLREPLAMSQSEVTRTTSKQLVFLAKQRDLGRERIYADKERVYVRGSPVLRLPLPLLNRV